MAKELRVWWDEDVRTFCIRHGFYTRGTSEEYDEMLQSVAEMNPTTAAIERITRNIMEHSTDRALEGMTLTTIMTMLFKETVIVFYE